MLSSAGLHVLEGVFAWAFGRPEIRSLLRRDARSVEALVAVLAETGFGDPAEVSALTNLHGRRKLLECIED